ncbi:MAG TPA: tRNA epoxyqueuosine(34) reductase QueG [Phycisphaerae bacterium]|nr:tRNA epoxyqueuosine(34) reductase QueG [Phycisphaerae bacterium]
MLPSAKTRRVKTLAAAVGFDRVGITHAGPVQSVAYYRVWLAAGHAGTMGYLRRNVEIRAEPARLLPEARSIICVALNYGRPEPGAPSLARQGVGDGSPHPPTGRVAQYARGRDYHLVMRGMLRELVERLRQDLNGPFEARVCGDTTPLLERELARAAGLGWIGKNTCLLHERLGSYLFLGEVLTTLELEPDSPVPDRCGTCTRCLDACPTKAFPAPYQLDASRCISYFTIEHRGEVAAEFHAGIGDWVFGCDICQQVCPFNAKAPPATHPEIVEDRIPARLNLLDLLNLGSADYRRLTENTAARRATRHMWRRNAGIALRNAQHRPTATRKTPPATSEGNAGRWGRAGDNRQ